MAFETVQIEVGPEDGWVKVGDDPSYLKIVIRDARPWALCVTPSGAPSPKGASASGTITFSGQPTATETVTVGGSTFTFVSSGAGGLNVLIGAAATNTRDNLLAAIQATVANVVAQPSGTLLITVTANAPGAAGNAIVLTEAATNVTVSGSGTLAGGVDESVGVRFVPNMQSGYGYEYTITGATTAEFYVRVWQAGPAKGTGFAEKTVFGVIRNNA